MGWAGGGPIISVVVDGLGALDLTTEQKVEFLRPLVDQLRDCDWDTLEDCVGVDPAFDIIFKEIYPDADLSVYSGSCDPEGDEDEEDYDQSRRESGGHGDE